MWVWMRAQLCFLIPRLLHSPGAPSVAGQAGHYPVPATQCCVFSGEGWTSLSLRFLLWSSESPALPGSGSVTQQNKPQLA